MNSTTVGVYVHVPFCERVCPYCDFAVEAVGQERGDGAWSQREDEYVAGLLHELDLRREAFEGRGLASLYFGGGTPSLLRPDSLARIREAVEAAFPPMPDGDRTSAGRGGGRKLEVTLEVNPSSLERERLADFRKQAGIGRLSLGVQSFDDSLLKALGRAHRSDEIRLTLEAARSAGFENISIDLIFAALHQSEAMWESDLAAAIAASPQHISTYELVFEEGTPFGHAAAQGRLKAFPSEASARMMESMEARLGAAGYRRYELTNFARPGWESVHNRRYWQREAVLGLGVGAHSTDPPGPQWPYGVRASNLRGRSEWLARLEAGEYPIREREVLDRRGAMAETCFLSLRCDEGLDESAFEAEFGQSLRQNFGDVIERLIAGGLLEEAPPHRLRLTDRGCMLADTVCAEFV